MAQFQGEPDPEGGEGEGGHRSSSVAYSTPYGGDNGVGSSVADNPGNPGNQGSQYNDIPNDNIAAGAGPGGQVLVDEEEYRKFLEMKERIRNMNGGNASTPGGPSGSGSINNQNQNSNSNQVRLVVTKEEQEQNREFIKYKRDCLKKMILYRQGNIINIDNISNSINTSIEKMHDGYSTILESFEKLEVKCNDQWDMNKLDREPQFDTIEAMKQTIREYTIIDDYIQRSTNQISNYLTTINNNLNKASAQLDTNFSKLRKDQTLPPTTGLDGIIPTQDDEKNQQKNDDDKVELLRLRREFQMQQNKIKSLEAELEKLGGGNAIPPEPQLPLEPPIPQALPQEIPSVKFNNDDNDRKLPDELPLEPPQPDTDEKDQHVKSSILPREPSIPNELPAEPNIGIISQNHNQLPLEPRIPGPIDNNNIIDMKPPPNYGVKLIAQWNINPPKMAGVASFIRSSRSLNDNNNNNIVNVLVCKGSVLDFTGDSIVNATNESCVGAQGVDGAITRAGGNSYAEEILKMKVLSTVKLQNNVTYKRRLYAGDANIIKSGYKTNNLKTPYVILTVGPRYRDPNNVEKADEQLFNAYKNCMLCAKKTNLKSVGFCLISAGLFRGRAKLNSVLKIGCQAIKQNLYKECEGIYIIAFTDAELDTLMTVAGEVFGKPDKDYVNERAR